VRAAITLIVGIGLTLPVPAMALQSATPMVESAVLTVDLTAGDGSASVRVEYRLSGHAPGAAIPIQLLGFGVATTDEVRVGALDPVVLWPTSGTLRVATVRSWGSAEGEASRFALEYDVLEAVEQSGDAFVVRVPIVVVKLPPVEEADELFRARVRLPAAWRVADGFPSGFRADGDDYSVSLPVVPSVVRLRGRVDGRWRPGLPLVVDLLVVSILLAFAFRGWRHLRRIAT